MLILSNFHSPNSVRGLSIKFVDKQKKRRNKANSQPSTYGKKENFEGRGKETRLKTGL